MIIVRGRYRNIANYAKFIPFFLIERVSILWFLFAARKNFSQTDHPLFPLLFLLFLLRLLSDSNFSFLRRKAKKERKRERRERGPTTGRLDDQGSYRRLSMSTVRLAIRRRKKTNRRNGIRDEQRRRTEADIEQGLRSGVSL